MEKNTSNAYKKARIITNYLKSEEKKQFDKLLKKATAASTIKA